MKRRISLWLRSLALVALLGAGHVPDSFRIFLAGDSTMTDKSLIDNPEHGWGQMFPSYFGSNVSVFNHARNGRSTRSFLLEGRWQRLISQVHAGDYVFIQFGHNDAKAEDTSRYAAPWTDYRNNLRRFVKDVGDRKGIAVLLTPVVRRNFDSTGMFVDKHGDYPSVVREMAKELGVALIDLHRLSKRWVEDLGPNLSERMFLRVPKGEYRALPDGKSDNTHFTRQGALAVAGLVAAGLRESGLPLAEALLKESPTITAGRGKVVGLDEYVNNEWRIGPDSTLKRHHYTWDDTTNGGFSMWGQTLDRLGANLDTLQSEPTRESLARFSVYIVVDPDIPKESPNPRSYSPKAIDALEQWVREGGILVLMGNDSGNAEFGEFNKLAGRFGMRFNEDSHHRVMGRSYETGTTSPAPQHPAFAGVRAFFMKECASLTLQPPAEVVLEERGTVLMAQASVGKGIVFAVGDAWLYNEYFDNRRLPKGVENKPAGEAFGSWLLRNARAVRQEKD